MEISQDDYDLLTELAKQFDYPSFDPKRHVTVKMMKERLGISYKASYNKLEQLVSDGTLAMEKIRKPNGRVVNGYYKVGDL